MIYWEQIRKGNDSDLSNIGVGIYARFFKIAELYHKNKFAEVGILKEKVAKFNGMRTDWYHEHIDNTFEGEFVRFILYLAAYSKVMNLQPSETDRIYSIFERQPLQDAFIGLSDKYALDTEDLDLGVLFCTGVTNNPFDLLYAVVWAFKLHPFDLDYLLKMKLQLKLQDYEQ